MPISRLNHTASALVVYASCCGFPSTGNTRLRLVANLCRMVLDPQEHFEGFHNQKRLLLPPFWA